MRRVYPWLVTAVAIHSLLLGILMLFAPLKILDALQWSHGGVRFFPAQSGLFLLILGVIYAAAVRRPSLAWILVLSKAFAVVFLVVETAMGNAPQIVYVTAAGDAVMGLAVWVSRPRDSC